MATQEMAFYRSLLDLAVETDLEPLLSRALRQVMALTAARWGYVEIRTGRDGERVLSVGSGTDGPEVETVRSALSQGVIGAALARGEAITTLDPELASRASVRTKRVDLVLCAPVGHPVPFGVVYLQGRTEFGPFTERHQELVMVMAEQLGVLADRLLSQRQAEQDPTRYWRRKLEADTWIGSSEATARLLGEVHRVLQMPVPTLLVGPLGAGRVQVAEVLHASSDREGELVVVDATLLSDDSAEDALFGPDGAWDRAGTLLLHEVAALPAGVQGQLAARLADSSSPWVLSSARQPLELDVSQGQLREKLATSLAQDSIRVPGLDERPEDLPLLANHLAHRKAAEHGMPPISLSPSALLMLESYAFPEHLHSLARVVHQGLSRALEDGAQQVTPKHLSTEPTEARDYPGLSQAVQDFTHRYIKQSLERHGGNVSATARDLDVSASYLHRLRRKSVF